MKKLLLPSIISGAILFVWQFLSYGAINLHEQGQRLTDKQDAIIEFLNGQDLEEATYIVHPSAPNSKGPQDMANMEYYQGKPWAMVSYHKADNSSMSMNMIRGLLVNFVVGFLALYLMGSMGAMSLVQGCYKGMTIGGIAFLVESYTNHIWYQSYGIWAHLLDGLIPWAIIGCLYARFWQNKRSAGTL